MKTNDKNLDSFLAVLCNFTVNAASMIHNHIKWVINCDKEMQFKIRFLLKLYNEDLRILITQVLVEYITLGPTKNFSISLHIRKAQWIKISRYIVKF